MEGIFAHSAIVSFESVSNTLSPDFLQNEICMKYNRVTNSLKNGFHYIHSYIQTFIYTYMLGRKTLAKYTIRTHILDLSIIMLCSIIITWSLLFPAPGCGIAIVTWMRTYRDLLGVRSLLKVLPVGSNHHNLVCHMMAFADMGLRSSGHVIPGATPRLVCSLIHCGKSRAFCCRGVSKC